MNKPRAVLTTTLAALRKEGACIIGYNKLVRSLQGQPFTYSDRELTKYIRFHHNEPINLLHILESNGVNDCLWQLSSGKKDYSNTTGTTNKKRR